MGRRFIILAAAFSAMQPMQHDIAAAAEGNHVSFSIRRGRVVVAGACRTGARLSIESIGAVRTLQGG
jgi:hypothetical protein